jgi:hypothetical protein
LASADVETREPGQRAACFNPMEAEAWKMRLEGAA